MAYTFPLQPHVRIRAKEMKLEKSITTRALKIVRLAVPLPALQTLVGRSESCPRRYPDPL